MVCLKCWVHCRICSVVFHFFSAGCVILTALSTIGNRLFLNRLSEGRVKSGPEFAWLFLDPFTFRAGGLERFMSVHTKKRGTKSYCMQMHASFLYSECTVIKGLSVISPLECRSLSCHVNI